ncbi:hypothetical protein FACS189461_0910 [Spirochaetia bacterium]|nr:hypothetical protein FACS189461_0910 [Spirochaetia bacterium]
MISLIKIYVISLKKSVERQESIIKQFNALGLEFEFFDAVNGKALTPEEIARYSDSNKAKKYLKRELTKGEIGCALSHFLIYKKIIDEHIDHAIILEDDAQLTDDFPLVIEALHKVKTHNYIIKLENPNSGRESRESVYTPWRQMRLTPGYKIVYPLSFISLATGYYIDNEAAQTLLHKSEKIFLAADDWEYWRQFIELRILDNAVVCSQNSFLSAIETERALCEKVKTNICVKKIKMIMRVLKRILR